MQYRTLLAALDGALCVYKPGELSISGLKKLIVRKICAEGNDVISYSKPPTIKIPIVEPHPETGALLTVGYREQMDYTLHPLVSGEEFRADDIRLEELQYMEGSSSGVCVFGVNNFCDELPTLMAKSWVNEYRIEGILGRETLKHEIKGRVTLKTDYEHVTRYRMAKLLSRVQAQYRKMAFETANVDLQSREAFELARKGLPRAQIPGVPVIYGAELDTFNPPYFALHLQVSGESDQFLRLFTHELGVTLGSTASCVRLQRRSIGPLQADHALLDKQITLQNVLRNISLCRKIIDGTSADVDVVGEASVPETSPRDVVDGLGLQEADEEHDAMRPAWPRNYT